LGFLAGVIAVLGAEVLLASLQHWVLETPIKPHPVAWVVGPLLSAGLIGLLGVTCCRSAVNTPPAVVLREAGA
jgi:putative ABC transport system permease protein